MQRIDLKESDWRSSIAKAKAMDWLIRHRVAGKSSVEVDNYVEKLCTHSCEVERHPGPTLCQKFEFSASIPITGLIACSIRGDVKRHFSTSAGSAVMVRGIQSLVR
jgi:hypothetical protein